MCSHRNYAVRPIIGDLGAGHIGSQAFCLDCHATVVVPGGPKQAERYYRKWLLRGRRDR